MLHSYRTIKEMQTLFPSSGVGFKNRAYAVQLAKSELAPEWERNCVNCDTAYRLMSPAESQQAAASVRC